MRGRHPEEGEWAKPQELETWRGAGEKAEQLNDPFCWHTEDRTVKSGLGLEAPGISRDEHRHGPAGRREP